MKLEIKDISLSIEDKRILKGISLSVGDGEFLALMGPNGSGKTTLLRCIMNFLKPEKGAVLIDARPIHTMPDRELARTFAVVPQNSQIDFSFTAHEMVMMGRTPHAKTRFIGGSRNDEVAARQAMEKTDTWKFADRDFLSLSGGEKQRVIIARALAQEPKILLLDEPTVYLDITGQLNIMDLLRTLNHEGLTIIAVMHDINLASRYCNRVALLHEGRLASFGTPEEVFTPENIAGIYDVEVIVRRDPLTNSVSVIPKMASSVSAMHGTRVHILCGGGSGGHIASDLVDAGYSPSAGVINVLDSDFELAKDLHIPVVTEIPFAQISNEAYEKNLDMVREVKAVVVTDFPVGPGNLRNLEAASVALSSGKKVFILGSETISDRDFVGGKAKLLVDELIRKGAVTVKDKRELVSMLGEKLGR